MFRFLLPVYLLASAGAVNLTPVHLSAASKGQIRFALENKYDNTGPGATNPEYAYKTYNDLNEALTAYLEDPDTKLPLFDRSRAVEYLYRKMSYFDDLTKNSKLKINRPKNVPIVTSSYSRASEPSKSNKFFAQNEERFLVPLKDLTFDFIKPLTKSEGFSSSEYRPKFIQDIEYYSKLQRDGQVRAKVVKQQPIEVRPKAQQVASLAKVQPEIGYHPKLGELFAFQLEPALQGGAGPWTYHTHTPGAANKYNYRPHPEIEFEDTHDKETGDLKSAQELRDGSGAVHGYYSAPARRQVAQAGQPSSSVSIVQEHPAPHPAGRFSRYGQFE